MICIPSHLILEEAKRMPVGYLQDCKSVCTINEDHDLWCFSEADHSAIRAKYRGYAVSESGRFREGQKISGCCDRADQY
jgi:hypothetical protein